VEQLLLRKQQLPKLTTYLIFPGLIYGAGEADRQLHGLFRQAWENEIPLEVWGSGTNLLPTVCVHDLASWCVEVALQQPAQQVVLAVDGVGVRQLDLVSAVGQALGSRQGVR
jgi:adenylate kinase